MSGVREAVVLLCGLPASGKTTTAQRLHARLGGTLIRSCDVYQALGISLPDWVRRTRGFTIDVAAYEAERDRAYDELGRRLSAALRATRGPVVVDAVHGEPQKRAAMYRICVAHGRDPLLLWCACDSLDEVRRRFAARRGRETVPENEASDLSVFTHIAGLWRDPTGECGWPGAPVRIVRWDTLGGRLGALQGPRGPIDDLIATALGAPLRG